MKISLILLQLASVLYTIAFVFHLVSFYGDRKPWHRTAFALMRIGFLLSTLYFLAEAGAHEYFLPVSGFSQAMAFFAWSLAFVYLVLLGRAQVESFGLILTPILMLFTEIACLTFYLPDYAIPGSLSPFFIVHIVAAFFAYACFSLSFAAAVLYLIQQHQLKRKQVGQFYYRLMSLERLDRLIYTPMIWGSVLLPLAIAVGLFWSKSVFGVFWIHEPKTILSLMTTAVYLILLGLRFAGSLQGKRMVVFSLAAFGLVLFSFVGSRFFAGSHNFIPS